MEFRLSCSTQYLTRSLRSLVIYRVEHEKRNSISPSNHVLFSIYKIIKIVRDRTQGAGGILNSSANSRQGLGFAELSRILRTSTRLRKTEKVHYCLTQEAQTFYLMMLASQGDCREAKKWLSGTASLRISYQN